MINVKDRWLIQIEITNACVRDCANCLRFIGHYNNPHTMTLEMVERAIDSLEGFPGGIGITGGEPTMHPQFAEICEIVRKRVPPEKRFVWTTGYKWSEYESVIRRTFPDRHINLNDHRDDTQEHHPMLVAIDDMVPDEALRAELIDNCWVKERWSASITPRGCFFCEIAANFDSLFNGPGGLPVEKGWWAKGDEYFKDQVERNCGRCGAAYPQPAFTVQKNVDQASKTNYRDLENLKSPKLLRGKVALVEGSSSASEIRERAESWRPWEHWGDEGKSQPLHELDRNGGKGLMRTWREKVEYSMKFRKINFLYHQFMR